MESKDVNVVSNGLRSVSATLPRSPFGSSPSPAGSKEGNSTPTSTKGRGIMQSRIPVRSLRANFENPSPGAAQDLPAIRPVGRRYDPRAVQTLSSNRKVNAIIQQVPVSPRKSPLLRRKFPQTQLPSSTSPTSSPPIPSSPTDDSHSPDLPLPDQPTSPTAHSSVPASSSSSPDRSLSFPLSQRQVDDRVSNSYNSTISQSNCTLSQLIAWPSDQPEITTPQASTTQLPGLWTVDTNCDRPHLGPSSGVTGVENSVPVSDFVCSPHYIPVSPTREKAAPATALDRHHRSTSQRAEPDEQYPPPQFNQPTIRGSFLTGSPNESSDECVSAAYEGGMNGIEHCDQDSDDCSSHSESSMEALEGFYSPVGNRSAPLQFTTDPGRPFSSEAPIAISQASAAVAMAEASSFPPLLSPATVLPPPPSSNYLTVPDQAAIPTAGSSCDLDEDDWEERVSSTIYPNESASMVGAAVPTMSLPANPNPVAYQQSPPRSRQAMSQKFIPPPLKSMEMTQICPEPILSPRLDISPEVSPQFSAHPSPTVPEPQKTCVLPQSGPDTPPPPKSSAVGDEESALGFYRVDEEIRGSMTHPYSASTSSIPPPLPPKESAYPTQFMLSRSSSGTQGRPSAEAETYSNLYNKLLPNPPTQNDLAFLASPNTQVARTASAVSLRDQMATNVAAGAVVAATTPEVTASNSSESPNPTPKAEKSEQVKKLVERRHILKEFVDTERSFHNDMMILNDIYKGTSEGVLTEIDRRTLFGNIEQVCTISGKLSDAFRSAADPAYAAKLERGKNGTRAYSDHVYPTSAFTEWPEEELRHFDMRTELGAVFSHNMTDIYEVYGYYLKNHTWANAKLSDLENEPSVAGWLEECRASASDLTAAWNLNALLVKPMQRITKYPLMLRTLLKATTDDHPDRPRIERAIEDLEEKLRLWNESQEGGSNKKESADLFPKLVNRRAEKSKQQVGITNSLEDPEYDKLSQRFGGHFFQLQIVIRDINAHIDSLQANMSRHTAFVAAAEAFCQFDQHPSFHHHPEVQSGLVTYSRIVTDMATVGLPRHIGGIRKHVLDPLEQLWKLHQGPQELMRRRKKRGVEYYRWRQLLGRGETPDRKLREAAEQFKTTNDRLKDELPKLYDLSRKLVKACLDNLISLQSQWHDNWVRKLDLAAREPDRTDDLAADLRLIGEEYVAEFGLVQTRLRDLGLCNGNLRTLADPSGFLGLSSGSGNWDDPASMMTAASSSRGRAGTISSSHRTGSVKSDADVNNRLSATTFASTFGRSAVDVGGGGGGGGSGSARSSRGPITPQSLSQGAKPALSKAPSFSSSRSGRHGHRGAVVGGGGGQQPATAVRSSSGTAGANSGAAPPRLSLDLSGGSDDFGPQSLSLEELSPSGLGAIHQQQQHQNHSGAFPALKPLRSLQSLPSSNYPYPYSPHQNATQHQQTQTQVVQHQQHYYQSDAPVRSPTNAHPFSSVMPIDAEDGSARLLPMTTIGGGGGDRLSGTTTTQSDENEYMLDHHHHHLNHNSNYNSNYNYNDTSNPSTSSPGRGADGDADSDDVSGYKILFVAGSLYEFRVDDTRSFVGFPYLQYSVGEIFDVIGQNGELWMARNQDDPERRVGWIWERHFGRILPEDGD